jgi:hypothetical protein
VTSRYFLILPDNVGHGKSSKPSDGLWMRRALCGKHRFGLGYSIPLVMRETRILTSVIFDVLQEFSLEIKISRTISDVAELGLSIQKQLEQSVRAFIEMDLAARPA